MEAARNFPTSPATGQRRQPVVRAGRRRILRLAQRDRGEKQLHKHRKKRTRHDFSV